MGTYIYHHGILGQKWGKKNGPPYPLSSSAHSSSEKKAGWKKSLRSNQSNTLKRARHKNINDMSNKELSRTTKRLKLEEEFQRYTKTNSDKVKDYVANVLLSVSTTLVTTALVSYGKTWLKEKGML